ncbi:hypothetical protein GCM10022402_34540 [Salinactinospora qingdaonensis]|uniref:Uncharacterized protein n=1 Tax=Salinactinospora qingdaonensis TaxID=702744 RepID=A0ABP7G028_9ACTN
MPAACGPAGTSGAAGAEVWVATDGEEAKLAGECTGGDGRNGAIGMELPQGRPHDAIGGSRAR